MTKKVNRRWTVNVNGGFINCWDVFPNGSTFPFDCIKLWFCNVTIYYTVFYNYMQHHFYRATQLCYRGLGSRNSVRLSVRQSVCLQHACFVTNPKNRQAIFFTPHERPILLVFWCQRSQQNSNGVTPNGGAKERWVRLKRRFSTNIWLYLTNGAK